MSTYLHKTNMTLDEEMRYVNIEKMLDKIEQENRDYVYSMSGSVSKKIFNPLDVFVQSLYDEGWRYGSSQLGLGIHSQGEAKRNDFIPIY